MYSLSRLIRLSPFGEIQLFKEPRYLIVRTARSQRRIDFFTTFIESCSDIELKGCSLLEIGFNPSEAKMERNRSNRLINNRLCVPGFRLLAITICCLLPVYRLGPSEKWGSRRILDFWHCVHKRRVHEWASVPRGTSFRHAGMSLNSSVENGSWNNLWSEVRKSMESVWNTWDTNGWKYIQIKCFSKLSTYW